MTGIALQLEAALATLDADASASANIRAAKALARTTLVDAKRILLDLPPAVVEERELGDAIREMLRNLTDGLPVSAFLRIEGTVRRLPVPVKANMYRVAQEAVTNALRHSRARRIEVVLQFIDDELRLIIRDDGGGSGSFSRDEVLAAAAGQGVSGMQQRAREMHGTLSTRVVGRGVEIALVVPS
jgi:signal transduction histidine kinase